MPTGNIYTAAELFTGEKWLRGHSIITGSNGLIEEIVPTASLAAGTEQQVFEQGIIAPAFIDLQIYGAGEKLLAVYPEAATLYALNEYCTRGGTAFCLPTVATNTKQTVFQCIDALRDYWQRGGKGVWGLHLEGPWINPAKRGAHVEALIHAPDTAEVREYLEYGKDCIKMITLAPEICTPEILALIRSYGIVISAGHSNATCAEAKQGFDQGISAVTHLFNAMSPLQHRAPGLAGAAMDEDRVMASIIPDGHHVDYTALRIAKKAMQHRLFVITDAVTGTTSGYYQHRLEGDKYEADGILSGSALSMNQAVQNLVQHGVATPEEALRMCSLYPATLMNRHHQYGKIEPGYQASMVVLDRQYHVIDLLTG